MSQEGEGRRKASRTVVVVNCHERTWKTKCISHERKVREEGKVGCVMGGVLRKSQSDHVISTSATTQRRKHQFSFHSTQMSAMKCSHFVCQLAQLNVTAVGSAILESTNRTWSELRMACFSAKARPSPRNLTQQAESKVSHTRSCCEELLLTPSRRGPGAMDNALQRHVPRESCRHPLQRNDHGHALVGSTLATPTIFSRLDIVFRTMPGIALLEGPLGHSCHYERDGVNSATCLFARDVLCGPRDNQVADVYE